MKMTRNILRRLEMKIHHAMTLDQVRKYSAEPPPKPEPVKVAKQLVLPNSDRA